MTSKYGESRKFGRFFIARFLLDYNPNIVRQIMNNMIILEARYSYDRDGIEYLAISDLFAPVNSGDRVAEYDIEFNVNSGVKAIQCGGN